MGDETVEIVRRYIEKAEISNSLNTDQQRHLATGIVDRLRQWGVADITIERIFE